VQTRMVEVGMLNDRNQGRDADLGIGKGRVTLEVWGPWCVAGAQRHGSVGGIVALCRMRMRIEDS